MPKKSRNRLNRIYWKMRERCYNKRHNRYKYYGAKGVTVEWISYRDFKKDMENAYRKAVKIYGEKNVSIDRINPKGNYSKENCRWSDHFTQQRNRRNSKRFLYKGEWIGTTKAAEIIGLSPTTLRKRLKELVGDKNSCKLSDIT